MTAKGQRAPRAKAKSRRPIVLGGRLTISDASGLRQRLLASVKSGGPVVLDGTRVVETDTAILQLLTSLWRTCRERGIACNWQGVSQGLRDSARLIGVAEALHFPDGIAG